MFRASFLTGRVFTRLTAGFSCGNVPAACLHCDESEEDELQLTGGGAAEEDSPSSLLAAVESGTPGSPVGSSASACRFCSGAAGTGGAAGRGAAFGAPVATGGGISASLMGFPVFTAAIIDSRV